MTEPTAQDIQNARLRQEIAARFLAEYRAAEALAVAAFGPGWSPAGRHYLVAHAEAHRCRMTGERPKPAAEVLTVAKGGEKRHLLLTDAGPREVSGYEEGFGAMLTEPDPEKAVTWQGKVVQLHRFGLYWAGFEPGYRPRTADQLAAARVKREGKAVEREAERFPLFADAIRAEGTGPITSSPSPA